jgi:predicted DNA-binding helix-hairpin-helix protein
MIEQMKKINQSAKSMKLVVGELETSGDAIWNASATSYLQYEISRILESSEAVLEKHLAEQEALDEYISKLEETAEINLDQWRFGL